MPAPGHDNGGDADLCRGARAWMFMARMAVSKALHPMRVVQFARCQRASLGKAEVEAGSVRWPSQVENGRPLFLVSAGPKPSHGPPLPNILP
jgi:hypothetical protein